MTANRFKIINSSWQRANVRYSIIGLLVGLFISAFQSAYAGQWLSWSHITRNILFSLFITLSIVNSLFVFERIWRPCKIKLWQLITLYYICNALGMLIGIEISYGLVSLIFHAPFMFLHHYEDYRFSLFMVLIVSTIIYFYQSQRNAMQASITEKELDVTRLKQLKTQAELQTLQSKINPHFLYNALNSIASLIHEDADKAEDMTLKLSRLFRYSINSQQENMAAVKEEMEIVSTYLDIEKVRFGDRISFTSWVDPAALSCQIPRFLIQPLVENALKHGLNNTVDGGLLHIAVDKTAEGIAIVVSDNGTLFPDELQMGYGLQSTYDKLQLLYGDAYRLQISNAPQKHIRITLPLTA